MKAHDTQNYYVEDGEVWSRSFPRWEIESLTDDLIMGEFSWMNGGTDSHGPDWSSVEDSDEGIFIAWWVGVDHQRRRAPHIFRCDCAGYCPSEAHELEWSWSAKTGEIVWTAVRPRECFKAECEASE